MRRLGNSFEHSYKGLYLNFTKQYTYDSYRTFHIIYKRFYSTTILTLRALRFFTQYAVDT